MVNDAKMQNATPLLLSDLETTVVTRSEGQETVFWESAKEPRN
jgi:hypothetical protein